MRQNKVKEQSFSNMHGHQKHPGSIKTKIAGLYHNNLQFGKPGVGLGICISSRLLGDAGPGSELGDQLLH